jgi:ATP-dependent DNA helicase RecG
MRTVKDIIELLPELEHGIADDLEDQDLDFKQWDGHSRDKAVKTVVQMAVCMANGGGGTVVLGVADRVKGRAKAILGVPPEIDINLLKKAVYDQTDPKITPVFEYLSVPEGTGRLILMQIYPGMPPHTDTAGRGTIRIGRECRPLTGTLRRKISVETGETDYTAEAIAPFNPQFISATAMEALRNQAAKERAPEDLLKLSDSELLNALGLVRHGKLARAGLLLAGTETAIREYVPGHNWAFLQMTSDTEYGIREDRVSALPFSVQRIEELLVPFNPITTYEQGLFHYEYRTWPEIAVREALMNAFCHADLRIAGPIMVKLHPDRLEIGNNGGFIAGITPENILHHQPAARNPLLVEALTRLRLVNRNNLGVRRMFSAFLIEGKQPPIIREMGESVTVTLPNSPLDAGFRILMADIQGAPLKVAELIVLRSLWANGIAQTDGLADAAHITMSQVEAVLDSLAKRELVEPVSEETLSHWRLTAGIRKEHPHKQAKSIRDQLSNLLKLHPDRGMAMAEIIDEIDISRSMAKRLLEELHGEGRANLKGKGRAARWFPR